MQVSELLGLEWEENDDTYLEIGYKGVYTFLPYSAGEGIGVDPGRNWGYAICHGNHVQVWWGIIQPKQEEMWRYGVGAYDLIRKFLAFKKPRPAVVEGPAFTKTHGQVHLESVRFGFALGFLHAGFDVAVVPPAKVRAQVMGHAHNDPSLFWPTINHNGANAAAMALYAAGVRREGKAEKWP